jgi:hypothetical protein
MEEIIKIIWILFLFSPIFIVSYLVVVWTKGIKVPPLIERLILVFWGIFTFIDLFARFLKDKPQSKAFIYDLIFATLFFIAIFYLLKKKKKKRK